MIKCNSCGKIIAPVNFAKHLKNDHMQSIESLALLERNLRQALDESSDVAITDKNGIITYANDTFCNSSKYSKEELIGKTHRILKSGYHSPEFYKNMWGTITSGKVWHDEIKNKAKDGTFYWDDMVIIPFLDENKEIQEFVCVRRNITERRKLEDEKVKNEKMISIGQLSSRLAHDLRNPLSIIQITLENLRSLYGTDETTQERFEKIGRSIDRMSHQIDDVLGFVRGQPVTLVKTILSEIIRDATNSMTVPDNVTIILPKNDVEILCDKRQFEIVFTNLILNGIQAIDGNGTVEITIEEKKDENIIQVKDSGKGILKEDLDKIFEPLFTTKMRGTGLGLASVRSIIEVHGGIISVTSPPTIFTITLPKQTVLKLAKFDS